MADSLIKLNEEREAMVQKFAGLMPDLAVSLKDTSDEAYKEGAVSAKTKRLMALAIALGVGCQNCELGQAMKALELGVTREEVRTTLKSLNQRRWEPV